MPSLRTQFNRESSKEKTQKSGSSSNELYKSKWEYMSSLHFLKMGAGATLMSVTTSNLDSILIESDDSSSSSSSSVSTSVTTPNTNSILIESDDSSASSSNSLPTNTKRRLVPSQRLAKKTAHNHDVEDELIQKALAVIEKPSDELDIFGQFIASEMRQLPNISVQRAVKSEIMKILINFSTPFEFNLTPDQMNDNLSAETAFVIIDNNE